MLTTHLNNHLMKRAFYYGKNALCFWCSCLEDYSKRCVVTFRAAFFGVWLCLLPHTFFFSGGEIIKSYKALRIFSVFVLIITVAFWGGCDGKNEKSKEETKSSSITVYITDTGTKYHRSSCASLWNSKKEIDLEDAIDRGYSSCRRCDPPEE